MGILRAILEILRALAGPVGQLWRDKIQRDKQPHEIAKREREEIAREVAQGDSAGAAARLDSWLSDIRRGKQRSNSGVPGARDQIDGNK